jgi:hypothetical protein
MANPNRFMESLLQGDYGFVAAAELVIRLHSRQHTTGGP